MESPEEEKGAWRPAIFLSIAACFVLQTFFVYSDFPDNTISQHKFSELAMQGRDLWRENNCQSCHQIYGFGGFLGPDLTNLLQRRPDDDWEQILTLGRKQMPAFDFSEEEQEAIVAFLRETGETGQSIPEFARIKEGVDDNLLIQNYLAATGKQAPPAVLRGEKALKDFGCHSCHDAFREGRQRSPDLSLTTSLRSAAYVREALLEGKGTMPSFGFLTEENLSDIQAYLEWLGDHRQEIGTHYSILKNGSQFNWSALPWFEYSSE